MKNIRLIMLGVLCLLFVIHVGGCKDDDGGDSAVGYNLTTQKDVNNVLESGNISYLIISGEDITDLSALKFASIGSLIIRNTNVLDLSLPNLTSVQEELRIEGNSKLIKISDLSKLKEINGELVINNNVLLTDISGLLDVQGGAGTISVINNKALGEDKPLVGEDYSYGLFPLRYLYEKGKFDGIFRIADNHPKAATDIEDIGKLEDGISSYTIASRKDALEFAPTNTTVRNLTISGSEITDEVLRLLTGKVKKIIGTLTIEGTVITNTEGFFDVVSVEGDIIFRNNTPGNGYDAIFSNGLRFYEKINGDLIIDNTPIKFWGKGSSFAQIKEIAGDFRILNNPYQGTRGDELDGMPLLKKVGGDLEVSGCPNIVNMQTFMMALQEIGGKLIYKNNPKVVSLSGFESLKSIGNGIEISRNGNTDGEIPTYGSTGRPGWCMVKAWIEDEIVKSTSDVILTYSDGELVDLSMIEACDGFNPSKDDGIPKDYEINGAREMQLFLEGPKGKAVNLTIKGEDITQEMMNQVQYRIESVSGVVTWDNLSIESTRHFFNVIDCQGGIIIKNCPKLVDPSGFQEAPDKYRIIHGDFIIENCPNFACGGFQGWSSFNCITKVEGDLRLIGIVTSNVNSETFKNLTEVEGDFELRDIQWFWELNFKDPTRPLPLEKIGGDLIIQDCHAFWQLDGLAGLKSVGGDVVILNTGVPTYSTDWQLGLCYLKYLKDSGTVFKPDVKMTLGSSDNLIDVDSLSPCGVN